MATLILSTVGSALGGPIGGTIGALVGQQIDGAIIGSGSNEGPRINDLAVTTSTYGQAIPRLFGTMRVPGSIIWSTDLQETSETNGNGKGKPKTTTYSYSMSFAVAVASQPISGIGRIWADGNLLRGAGGDLKVGGQFRLYQGFGDQAPDPLMQSAIGAQCPAFRGLAYAVFEDLQLADFGNRIPTLTFEVFSAETSKIKLVDLVPFASDAPDILPKMEGFADNGGSLLSSLSAINRVFPLSCVTTPSGLTVTRTGKGVSDAPLLPRSLKSHRENEGRSEGDRERTRLASSDPEPRALRYFDTDRDYQASVQRAIGIASAGREVMIELPAAMNAIGAREICNRQTISSRWQKERLSWHVAELDSAIGPGTIVRIPDQSGYWLIKSWEWMERGVELSLKRVPPDITAETAASSGSANSPFDGLASLSSFAAFELPWDGIGSPNDALIFAAATGTGANWSGAALFVEQDNVLVPINNDRLQRAVIGELTEELEPSTSTLLETQASIFVSLTDPDAQLSSTTVAGLTAGENRILIGEEVVQFLCAEPTEQNIWKLTGLLRGRGGTEFAATQTHPVGTRAVLINDAIAPLDPNVLPASGTAQLAAIGLGDEEPVFAPLTISGISRNPLSPVHTRVETESDGSLSICWTRRSRGQWHWPNGIETPLIEEAESYVIGCGPIENPHIQWQSATPQIALDTAQVQALRADHTGEKLWVRQIGTFGLSPATLISQIS